MTDTRFTTVFDDLDELLSVVDIDVVGDIETLLMLLLSRPVGVYVVSNDAGAASSIEVIVQGNDESIGSTYEFPMSVMELARSCADSVDELGPYTRDGFTPGESPDIAAMSDDELITALQQALGKVRLFNMMDADG